jgi:cephalosporin-C deacetylase-like acetyl esterase
MICQEIHVKAQMQGQHVDVGVKSPTIMDYLVAWRGWSKYNFYNSDAYVYSTIYRDRNTIFSTLASFHNVLKKDISKWLSASTNVNMVF